MGTKEVIQLRLSGQHEVGMTLVLETPAALLNRRPAPGKWNILEHFAHLTRYQNVFVERVTRILTQVNPRLERYSAETDPEFPEWLRMDEDELIHQLINDRFTVFNRFLGFSAAHLKRTGVHPVYGQLTLLDWHEFFVLHEAHHLHAMWKLSKTPR